MTADAPSSSSHLETSSLTFEDCGLLLCKTQCCNHILSLPETLEHQKVVLGLE